MEKELKKARLIFILSFVFFIFLSLSTFIFWEKESINLLFGRNLFLNGKYIKLIITLLFICDIPFFCVTLNNYTALKLKDIKPKRKIKTVNLDKPLNIIEHSTIRVKSVEELIEVARAKKSIILKYIFNPYLTYLYVVENKTVYLYEKRLKKAPVTQTIIKKPL